MLVARRGQHRRHQAEHDARQRGMRARLQQADPQHRAGQHVGVGGPHSHPLQGQHHQDADRGHQQAGVIQPARIEHRDDQHGDDVVDDRQRQQEDAHAAGNGPAQQRQHADRERDVGGGGHGPALALRRLAVEREIDQRRHRHAAQRGRQRQRRLGQAGQRAFVDLAPYLHADHEKEHRHQCIVDPEMQGLRDDMAAHAEGQRRMPQGVVAGGVGRVGPDQGDGGGGQQHDAADGFDMKESFQREQGSGGKILGARNGPAGGVSVHGNHPRQSCTGGPTDAQNLLPHVQRQHPALFYTNPRLYEPAPHPAQENPS